MTTKEREEIAKRASNLAPKLMEIFPRGKKDGTNLYWRGSMLEVSAKLKKFFIKLGTDYSDEDIIKATQAYVESFNGMYSYMRVLKYFIFKNIIQRDEECNYIENVSDLATYLDNLGQEDELRNDWISTLK